ncbi:hypothetical protein MAR_005847, partial [Mya arenaria]
INDYLKKQTPRRTVECYIQQRKESSTQQRQAAAQRIETQNPEDDECLTYAELDVKFLQAANARVPSRKMNTPTEYADIEFFSTQGLAVEQPGYHYASV